MLPIRALRQWYPGRSLAQDELAQLAGVTRRQLQWLESARMMPSMLETVHAVALALKLPIESLFAPEWRDDHELIIEERRRAMGLDTPGDCVDPKRAASRE